MGQYGSLAFVSDHVVEGMHMTARFRADQVGSLLRPPELLRVRAAHAEGKLELDALRQLEDRAILEAIAMQQQVGIDVYSDGEFRRERFLTSLIEAVDGFVTDRFEMAWRGDESAEVRQAPMIVGARLRPARRLTGHEVSFLQKHAPGAFKITLTSPTLFMEVAYKPGLTDQFYATRADLLQDLVRIVGAEIRALVDEGVSYVQMDAPHYTYYLDGNLRDRMRQKGVDPDRAFDEAIAADNACFAGARRDGVTLALHVCRGNSRSRWFTEGAYDPIAERLFGSLDVDTFLLEYDSERCGGFEPLRFMPAGKTVVLGLVSTKGPQMESRDELMRQIEAASRYVPIEDLALSPQCGFASMAEGNLLSADDQRRKLELVVEVARRVWG